MYPHLHGSPELDVYWSAHDLEFQLQEMYLLSFPAIGSESESNSFVPVSEYYGKKPSEKQTRICANLRSIDEKYQTVLVSTYSTTSVGTLNLDPR